jgi:hypothetical protein
MEMFDLWCDCRPGDSGESEIEKSGSGDKCPKDEEVTGKEGGKQVQKDFAESVDTFSNEGLVVKS